MIAKLTAQRRVQPLRQVLDEIPRAAPGGRRQQARAIAQRLHLPHGNILARGQLVVHEVLEDHAHLPAQVLHVVLP